jgi:ubiquinone/menaquinone biosynthesis C-methylase UbiE
LQFQPDMNSAEGTTIPDYLSTTYWWAYVSPRAVRVFERQWLVNMILWGNYRRLQQAALAAFGDDLEGRSLQVACVYGDLTRRWLDRHSEQGKLDVVDVLPVQLNNLARKLGPSTPAGLYLGDSAKLGVASASYDRALLFFLLHEQPEAVRRATVAEALRVVRPGGKVVLVDYHRPSTLHPLYWPMKAVLSALEPYALDLWRGGLCDWLPEGFKPAALETSNCFGGLYQKLEITI